MMTPIMNWVTLYTKPNMERHVSGALQDKGIETYLPIVNQYSRHRRRKEPCPFFPCYLFVRIDLASPAYGSLPWTPGLRCVVRFDNRPALVPDQVIAQVREHLRKLERSGYCSTGCQLWPGEHVLITAGPFRDLESVFDRGLSKQGRVRVFLAFLGWLTTCGVEADWLVRAS
jgi:transcription antitermination factor NusG